MEQLKRKDFIEAISNITNEHGDKPLRAVHAFNPGMQSPSMDVKCIKEKYSLAKVGEGYIGDFEMYGMKSPIVGREGLSKENLEDVAKIIMAYSFTELIDREEEKKYAYRFPFNITRSNKTNYHVRKVITGVQLESADLESVENINAFQFTDKEIEKYKGLERTLFDACEKYEVTQ